MGVTGTALPIIVSSAQIVSAGATAYKIAETIGKIIGNAIRDKSLTLVNKHRHKIWIVVMYKRNNYNDWIIKGWFGIIPFDTFTYYFKGIKCRTVYYYAECGECNFIWGNGDAKGYVPTSSPAFTYYNSERIGQIRDFSKIYLGDNDRTRHLTGY